MNVFDKNRKIIVGLFFVIYLGVGIFVFDNYGVGSDEANSRRRGRLIEKYVFTGDKEYPRILSRAFAGFYEFFLVLLEKRIFKLDEENTKAIYLMRHLFNFLFFFLGVIFFYKLIIISFRNWNLGLLGSLFLILSPRIFAHSFYNPKDIPCLVMFIISIYTLIMYLDKKTISRAAIHALASALVINTRVVGIIVPLFTFTFLISDMFLHQTEGLTVKRIIHSIVIYVILLIFFTILFWPGIWLNPFVYFSGAIQEIAHYPKDFKIFYFGKNVYSLNLPWHYLPIIIGLTTPLFYAFFFFIGLFVTLTLFLKNPLQFYKKDKHSIIFFLWFFIPLTAVIVLKSTLYNGWRHMFFIYPAFLLFTLKGIKSVLVFFEKDFHKNRFKYIILIFTLVTTLCLLPTIIFMIKNHPYQNVYYNRLAGKSLGLVKEKFEMDYWKLAFREGLEFIAQNDADNQIKIYAPYQRKLNGRILPTKDRYRFKYTDKIHNAKYALIRLSGNKRNGINENEVFSVKVDDTKILAVYKMK